MKSAIQTFTVDVLVVGAGPAGVKAAVAAAKSGSSVHLLDDNKTPGGQIWRSSSIDEDRASTNRKSPRAKAMLELETSTVRFHAATQVVMESAPNELQAVVNDVEIVSFRYNKLILATGARELFLPFPQWTLPGVFGAGGLQALVRGGYDISGKRVAIVGTGPLLIAVAAHLREAGARIVLLADQSPAGRIASFAAKMIKRPSKLLQGGNYFAALLGTPIRIGWWPVEAVAGPAGELCGVRISNGRDTKLVECDLLAAGFHLVANTELPELLGCSLHRGPAGRRVIVDRYQRTTRADIFCAGETTGIAGLDAAMLQGKIAGLTATGQSADHLLKRSATERSFGELLDRTFSLRPELLSIAGSETIVCRCEDVTYSQLQTCSNWTEAKLQTRCGMGPCQGRICGPATHAIFGWEPASVRPPLFPVPLHALASHSASNYEEIL